MDRKEYETIWSAEDPDQEEFLSETDVEVNHEKQWRSEEGRGNKWDQQRGVLFTIKTHRWIIDTCFLALITGLLILLLLKPTNTPTTATRQVGGDFTVSNHEFTTKVIKWNADESFVPANTTEFFSDTLLEKWKTIFPAGAAQPDGQTYSATSMTHQLHCLFMMGRIFSALESGTKQGLMDGYQSHYLHCIDYMRQSVMCAGDVSLEPHSPLDGPDNGPLDGGWNGIHVCKNYDEVIGYLEGQIADGTRVVLPIDD